MYPPRNIQVTSQNDSSNQNYKPHRKKSGNKKEKYKSPKCFCSLGNSPRPKEIENFDKDSRKCACQNNVFQESQMFSKENMLLRIHNLKARLNYFENKFQIIESDVPPDFLKKSWKQNANSKLVNTENALKKKKRNVRVQVRSNNSTTTTSDTKVNVSKPKKLSILTEKSIQCLAHKSLKNIESNKSLIVVMKDTKADTLSNSSNENLLFMRKTLEELKDMTENLHCKISCMLGNVSSQKSDFGTDTRDSGISSLSHIALPCNNDVSDDLCKEKYAEITQSVENVEKKIDRLTDIVEKTLTKDSHCGK